jgi:hypothetical protein
LDLLPDQAISSTRRVGGTTLGPNTELIGVSVHVINHVGSTFVCIMNRVFLKTGRIRGPPEDFLQRGNVACSHQPQKLDQELNDATFDRKMFREGGTSLDRGKQNPHVDLVEADQLCPLPTAGLNFRWGIFATGLDIANKLVADIRYQSKGSLTQLKRAVFFVGRLNIKCFPHTSFSHIFMAYLESARLLKLLKNNLTQSKQDWGLSTLAISASSIISATSCWKNRFIGSDSRDWARSAAHNPPVSLSSNSSGS